MMRVTRLANGFTVASDRMDSVETLSIGVWADVGTRNEPADINGVSHLLEHMAFKGTERRSAREIAEEIEAVGGHLNAYTAREQTAYYAKTGAWQGRNRRLAFGRDDPVLYAPALCARTSGARRCGSGRS